METKEVWQGAAKLVSPIGCGTMALLFATSAGFSVVAEPQKVGALPEQYLPLPPTVNLRILSPPPTRFAPTVRHVPKGAVRLHGNEFEPVRLAARDATAVATSRSDQAPIARGFSGVVSERSAPTIVSEPAAAPMLMDARINADGIDTGETRSTAVKEISVIRTSATDSGTDDESRATALAMEHRSESIQPSETDRAQAVLPSLRDDVAVGTGPWSRAGFARYAALYDAEDRAERAKRAGVVFEVAAKVNGAPVGRLMMQVSDNQNFTIRLADLLEVVQGMMEPALYERLNMSQATQTYVTLNDLRAAGIPVRFNDQDQLLIGG